MKYLMIVFLLILAPAAARSQQLHRSGSEDVAKEADLQEIRADRARVDLELSKQGAARPWDGEDIGLVPALPNQTIAASRNPDPATR